MYNMLFIGGLMHGKRWKSMEFFSHVPVPVMDSVPRVRRLRPSGGMLCDSYGVLPVAKMHTEVYETKLAVIRGKEVLYLSHRGSC